jgi:hypothetical protein
MSEMKKNVNSVNQVKTNNIRLKAMAIKPNMLYDFLSNLQKVYPRESISCSQLLNNQGEPTGYHIFLKIILPAKTPNAKEICSGGAE